MNKQQIKAVRLCCGFTDDLRIKLPWHLECETPQSKYIVAFLFEHKIDLFGVDYYLLAGANAPWVNFPKSSEIQSNQKIWKWLNEQAKQICFGKPEK